MSFSFGNEFGFGKKPAGVAGLDSYILGLSPLAYYTLDEGTGTVATDVAGGLGDGTHSAGINPVDTALTSSGGYAVNYGGGAGGVKTALPAGEIGKNGQPFSMSCFAHFGTNFARSLMSWRHNVGGTTAYYHIDLTGNGISIEPNVSVARERVLSVLSANTSYHIAITFDGTSDWKIWLDGVEQTTITAFASGLGVLDNTLGAPGTNSLDGSLDRVAFWDNKALSQTEIETIAAYKV